MSTGRLMSASITMTFVSGAISSISRSNTRNESRFLAHRARAEAPSREKSSANWRPSPREAPVMRTCLAFNLFTGYWRANDLLFLTKFLYKTDVTFMAEPLLCKDKYLEIND